MRHNFDMLANVWSLNSFKRKTNFEKTILETLTFKWCVFSALLQKFWGNFLTLKQAVDMNSLFHCFLIIRSWCVGNNMKMKVKKCNFQRNFLGILIIFGWSLIYMFAAKVTQTFTTTQFIAYFWTLHIESWTANPKVLFIEPTHHRKKTEHSNIRLLYQSRFTWYQKK